MLYFLCAFASLAQTWPVAPGRALREILTSYEIVNLDRVPKPHGFKIEAFPAKIEKASPGWVRAAATLQD